jgi:hypothetical protein
MPTVFKNKADHLSKTTGKMQGEFHSRNLLLAKCRERDEPTKESPRTSQKVEYIAISKRLESKRELLEAPTVDVSKFRKTTYIPPNRISYDSIKGLIHFQADHNIRKNPSLAKGDPPKAPKPKPDNKMKATATLYLNLERNDFIKTTTASPQVRESSQNPRRRSIFGKSKSRENVLMTSS